MIDMSELYSDFKNAIIQIATPWGTGTGFYLYDYNLIVTNLNVTHGAKEMIISGNHFPKTMTKLLYADPMYDLAFIEAPESVLLSKVKLGNIALLNEGDPVTAIGQPYGLSFTVTKGVISKVKGNRHGKDFIQIDAAINSGNSGGPLINEKNEIVGVNSSIADGEKLGFALPVDYLKQALDEYVQYADKFVLRCTSCSNIITEENIENYYCPDCGTQIHKEVFDGKKYIPSSAGEKIEEIIAKLNYEVSIARVGQNFWEIEDGSAIIHINYDVDSRYVKAYAVLCKLPKENIGSIYEYLLKENNYLKGLSFSVVQQDILLSMMHIFEEDLHVHSAVRLFKSLFNKADDYDDILIEMGAIPLHDEE